MGTSLLVFLISMGALAIFDIVQVFRAGVDNTISVQMYQASKKNPVIPFLVGYLAGHLTWGQ